MFIYIFRLLKLIFDWTKSPMSHFLWWYKWLDVNFNERWNAKNCVDFTPYVQNMVMYICAELTWCYPRFDFHNNILALLLWYDTSFIHAWHRATHRFILRALTTLENLNFDCLQCGHTCIPFKVGWMLFFFLYSLLVLKQVLNFCTPRMVIL